MQEEIKELETPEVGSPYWIYIPSNNSWDIGIYSGFAQDKKYQFITNNAMNSVETKMVIHWKEL